MKIVDVLLSASQGLRTAGVITAFWLFASAPSTALAEGVLDKVKHAGKLVYCSDLSAPPFLYLDQKTMKPAGFDIDIAISVAKGIGVAAEFKNIAFDGLIPALQAGQCDAIVSSLFDKPKRRLVVDFVNYAEVGNVVIVKGTSTLAVDSLAGLSGHKIAAERGSVNEDELNQASAALVKDGKPGISVVAVPKITDEIQMTLSDLVEGFYTGPATVAEYNKTNPGALKLASPQISSFLTGIATLKNAADLHEALDGAFKKSMTDGTYAAIVKTWGFESMALKP